MNQAELTPAGDILVVDDTPANLRLLSGMLTENGYKVRSAPNGKLALMGARAAPPDLILLDINMPGLNGYEVCEQLKADERTGDIPVIFISALDQTEDKIQAFTLGGVDYITKPFQLEEVLARVETHLALHRLRCQLAVANTELRETNAELDAFAHTVAHDLKSPLTSIIGFSTLLESRFVDMAPERIADNLRRITGTGYKMRDIIEALLLLASVREADEVACESFDMGVVVADVLARLDAEIEAAQAEIIAPAAWPTVHSYAPWIEEVWVNYLSNALKYGEDRVTLGATEEENTIRFFVRDNGPGLSAEEQAQVFTPFTRFHHARAEGHGLGLSIVQRIVAKLGGDVGVESDGAGQGCTFWFVLPAES